MIVVADTTPLHYLILIDQVEILPQLLQTIVIPEIVFQELQDEKTPLKIKQYLSNLPSWLSIRQAIGTIDAELVTIDPGEREAILLAENLGADAILIDDLAGRRVAFERGLRVLGTLGMLELAHEQGLVRFMNSLDRIKNAGFFISRKLENELRLKYT